MNQLFIYLKEDLCSLDLKHFPTSVPENKLFRARRAIKSPEGGESFAETFVLMKYKYLIT